MRRWAEEVADTTEQAGSDGTALAPLVAQARQLVADIDVLAAVDDGSLRLALAVTDLRAVVEEAAARSALEAGAVVRVEPLVVGAALVWCDAGLVERAVRALVDNALQHAPGAAPPLVLVGRRGRWMDIAVHDRGPGIPASRLPLVFSRFGWLDRGANRGGVGLGLTLAREVARLHGGDVVHRNPGDGVGSVFTLRLPAAAEEEAARLVLAAGHSQ